MFNRRRKLSFALAALCVLAATAFVLHRNTPTTIPRVDFTTLGGERIASDSLHGKVVLVNFWSTTCTVCMHEMPHIAETYRTYSARGFDVIAVAMSYDRPDWVVDYSRRSALPFKVAWDHDGTLQRAFENVDSTPVSFLIDKHGRVLQRIVGAPDFGKLRERIEQAL